MNYVTMVGGGRKRQKISGAVLDSEGSALERDLVALSVNKTHGRSFIAYAHFNIIGKCTSDSSGNFEMGVLPVVKESPASIYDDSNSIIVIALGDPANNEKSVIFDQVSPVSLS